MENQKLTELAHRSANWRSDGNTLEEFASARPAEIVHILGNGPSARGFVRPEGHVVIAVNGALAQCPDADYSLAGESKIAAQPWFPQWQDYHGQVLLEAAVPQVDPAEALAIYPDTFYHDVLWFHRAHLRHNFNIRKAPYGLVYIEDPQRPGICYGSSALQAIHFAGLLGAKEIHLTGCEFCFTGGEQHADGTTPYSADSRNETRVVSFAITPAGKPSIGPGSYQSTPYFIQSAAACLQVIALIEKQGVSVIDHSGGLLSPGAFNPQPGRAKNRGKGKTDES